MNRISQDIGYRGNINIFNCRSCGRAQIMLGCNNSDCEEYYKNTERYRKEQGFFRNEKEVRDEQVD